MKPLKMIIGAAAVMVMTSTASLNAQKVLVLYYSQTSNTKAVAQEIATKLNADIEEVVAVNPYNEDFKATIERCMKEREAGTTPKIKPVKANIAKYDVIFLGYPIWFGTYAPPIATWLDKVDLSGKKVVPFCTFGSGGLESSVKDLASKQPKAEIIEGYGVRAARMDAMPNEVDQFLKANGFLKGSYVKLQDFSEQHAVSATEAAIFDGAVGDYPMMNAKAVSVATRPIPYGMEYKFTAVDKPRDNAPMTPPPGGDKPGKKDLKLPPPGEMTVFVIVANGEKPVFTKVIR